MLKTGNKGTRLKRRANLSHLHEAVYFMFVFEKTENTDTFFSG